MQTFIVSGLVPGTIHAYRSPEQAEARSLGQET
jgi:hypothetical protein